ncbi:MAG TPA: radical SAM protein [Candidatus Kapabacteria bacterium]|nr:radical SAM protein [Candidatus Kapabacteria bacterium]
MKVLMINSNRYKLPVPAMPFGMCCVASALEKGGHEVEVLDLCFSKNCTRDIRNALSKFKPDIIGISIRNIDTAVFYKTLFYLQTIKNEVIIPIKKAFSGPIVIGGTAVGIAGAEMLENFDLTYAICGDGEDAMNEFVKRIENNLPLNGLGGLIWRKDGKIVENNKPMPVPDMNALPFTRQYRYIDLNSYRKFRAPIQIQTKRGCALTCAYCTYNIVEGHHYRLRDPELVADEIESIVKETGTNHFEFSDSTFNIPLDHAKAVLRAINAKKMDLNLQIMGLNPGAVDEELVELMKEANFKEVQVGAESGSNTVLKSLKKNFTVADIIHTGEIIHKAGIPIMWHLMAGAPGETAETLKETMETIQSVASEWDLVVVMNAIRVFKGSPLSMRWLKENPSCSKDNFLTPVFYSPKGISLSSIRAFNRIMGFKHPNFLFPENVQRIPLFLLKISTAIMRIFAPQQPWWKINIFVNILEKKLGITAIKQFMFKYRNRELLTSM